MIVSGYLGNDVYFGQHKAYIEVTGMFNSVLQSRFYAPIYSESIVIICNGRYGKRASPNLIT